MICTLMEKLGALTFSKEEVGNKLLTIIISENNMQVLVIDMIQQKINFYHHNLLRILVTRF